MAKVLTLEVMLSKEIEHMLETEGYKEKQKLPSERDLAEYFGAQRLTIRAALQSLVQKGILISRERQGYYIAPKRIQYTLNHTSSFKMMIERMGFTSYVKLLEFEKIKLTDTLTQKTMLAEGTEVFRIMRLRFGNKDPIALERSYIVCDLAKDLSEEDVHNKSLYDTLKNKYRLSIDQSRHRVSVVYANGLESELLKVSPAKPLIKYHGLVYEKKGRLLEYFETIMLSDKIEFIIHRS
ncbi:MAG: GntR family transcriptional regulator [Bacillota bacterium]|jgi:GntR family transcriptional regulator|nr:GntR family transcriptional regulator [Bacillota bacterium]